MTDATSIAADQLRSIVERIERLHEDRKAIADDIAEIYGEAKGNGFDVPVLKRLIADRAKDQSKKAEFEAILELYEQAMNAPRARAREAA